MQSSILRKIILMLSVLVSASACVYPGINLKKQRILDPMMDPAKTTGLKSTMFDQASTGSEKGSLSGSGSVGGSCPTCGG